MQQIDGFVPAIRFRFGQSRSAMALVRLGFALSILRAGAMQIREQHERTRLTDRDRDLFLAIVDNERPNEALKRFAAKYAEDLVRGGPRVGD